MAHRPLNLLLKWAGAAMVLAAIFAAAYFVHREMQLERQTEESGERVQSIRRASQGVVDLGVEIAQRYGIVAEPAKPIEWIERVPIYGRLIPNPRATVELRSPFPGTLRADADRDWPAPGQWIKANERLGWVDIRVSPQERLDLQNRLDAARLKKQGEEEVVKIWQQQVERLTKLTQSEITSRRDLNDAQVQLANAQIELATADAAVKLWQDALTAIDAQTEKKTTDERNKKDATSKWSQPLLAPADGEVTLLAGHPGMAIEAGGLIAEIVDTRRPLALIDFPPQLLQSQPPTQLTITAVPANPPGLQGAVNQPEAAATLATIEAMLVGPSPRLDIASQFVPYWYDVALPNQTPADKDRDLKSKTLWRPGLRVKAFVEDQNSQARTAVSVPSPAVLFHEGRALVYVQIAAGKFEHRDVRVLGRDGELWVLAPRGEGAPQGIAPGEPVVYKQAQTLLSEEARIDVGAEP